LKEEDPQEETTQTKKKKTKSKHQSLWSLVWNL
jgi:hypothetical protein